MGVPLSGLYDMILLWLDILRIFPHQTARRAFAQHLAAVLAAQNLRSARRMRALPSALPVPARQRFRRTARALDRAALSLAPITAALVRAVLALVPPAADGRTTLALDGVRCGRWEILTLGVVWHGRALPVAWEVLPFPWPRGSYTPLTCSLIARLAAVWPAERPVVLVADRGFPSKALFATLVTVGWDWIVRLQSRNWVTTATYTGLVRGLLPSAGAAGSWAAYPGHFASGTQAVPGQIIVGKPQRWIPGHQRGAASAAVRQRQQERRLAHVLTKHRGRTPQAPLTDGWVILFTSLRDADQARRQYRQRWAIESSFRDAQGGWDGRHGWDLEATVSRQRSAERVAGVATLWAWASLVQVWIGAHVTSGPAPIQQAAAGWTTTARVSVWTQGHLALTDPHGTFTAFIQAVMNHGAAQLAGTPANAPPWSPLGLSA